MKSTKEMNNREFLNLQNRARNKPFSAFGQFAQDLKGLEVYRLTRRVHPYELYHFYQKRCLKDLEFNPYYTIKNKNNEQ